MPTLEEVRDAQRQTWDKFSGGWKKWDGFVMDWLRPAGDAILELAALKKTDVVLDVATGTGEPGLSAARCAASVTAVDVSGDMTRIAAEKAAARGLKNFSAQAFDGLRLPFPDASFDAVLCRHGLMFFPDVEAGARELARVLRPGGRLAAAYWLAPDQNPWGSVPGRVVQQSLDLPPPPPDSPGIFRCAKPGLVGQIFERCGLVDISDRELRGEAAFKDTAHFWEFLNDVVAPVASALAKADAAGKERARAALDRELAGLLSGGRLVFPWLAQVTAGR